MSKRVVIKRITWIACLWVCWISTVPVLAQLPADNLIQNPCFADGLNGWVNPSGRWVARTGEEKNPSPCGGGENGPVAKLGPERFDGAGQPGATNSLYQVVGADPAQPHLTFSLYYIAVRVDIFQVNIYGGDSPDGVWEQVWVPVSTQGTHEPFDQPVTAETELSHGYPFYKIEFQGQFTEGLGMKVTGVYFVVSGGSAEPAPTLMPTDTPQLATAVPATLTPPPTGNPIVTMEPTKEVRETAVSDAGSIPTHEPTRFPVSRTSPGSTRVIVVITMVLFFSLALLIGLFWISKNRG